MNKKKYLILITLVAALLLLVVTPVLANTRNWSWTMGTSGRVIDGKANGVLHSMTAGTLTLSGSVWNDFNLVGATGPAKITIEVRRQRTLLPDQLICSTSVTPDSRVGYQYRKTISKNCGSIVSGTYYLYIWRSYADGRRIKGEGTLRTP